MRTFGSARSRRSPKGGAGRVEGFTLVEIMVVVVILGLLATVVVIQVSHHLVKANQTAARLKIRELDQAVELFKMEVRTYPERLEDLVVRPVDFRGNWPEYGFLKHPAVPRDPWGGEFVYRRLGRGGPAPFEIQSYGADGREGGEGEDRDLSSLDAP